MKSSIFILLMTTLITAGFYWYQASADECPVPLHYRLGNIDQSFGISAVEALAHIAEAEAVWETPAKRELFVYDEEAKFSVGFIFDERQATANSEEAQREVLDQKREENEEVLQTVESLQAEYEKLASNYESRLASYENDLTNYNAEVNQYNDRGGAPPKIFRELEDQRIALQSESAALSGKAKELNALAVKINRLSDEGIELVNEYNENVSEYNEEFGYAREFTQGDFQVGYINIYKFSSENELVTVLAHEFGHALGIGHVEGTSSLMYYLLEETERQPTLSQNDLAAYYEVCGTKESATQVVRRVIREVLAKFN